MASETVTYEQVSAPAVTLTKDTSDTTGRVRYTVVVNLLGLVPTRSTTAEERLSGISSLDPPTVSANTPGELVRLAIAACKNSYNETEGYALTATSGAEIAYRVGFSVLQALRKLGEDV